MKCKEKDCNALSLKGDVRCYFHSDKITDKEKKQARSKGGKRKVITVNSKFDNYELNTITDVMKLNAVMINRVLNNKLDLRIATGICYLLNTQIKGIELKTIESKIFKMEDIVIKLPPEFGYPDDIERVRKEKEEEENKKREK